MKNCKEMRELISIYVDNELSVPQKIDVERHLAKCQDCKEIYKTYLELSNELKGTESQELPDGFSESLHHKLLAESKSLKSEKRIRTWKKLLVYSYAATAVFVIGIFTLWGFNYYKGVSNNILVPGHLHQAGSREDSSKDDIITKGVETFEDDKNQYPGIGNKDSKVQPTPNKSEAKGKDSLKSPAPSPVVTPSNKETAMKLGQENKKVLTDTTSNTNVTAKTGNTAESSVTSRPAADKPTPKAAKSVPDTTGAPAQSQKPEQNTRVSSLVEMPQVSLANVVVVANNKKEAVNKIIDILLSEKVQYSRMDELQENNQPATCLHFKTSYADYKSVIGKINAQGYNSQIASGDLSDEKEIEVYISVK